MIFDARTLAAGWLSVTIAASTDKGRPALCRTVLVEQFQGGVRLVSTDSYMLLRAWVPAINADLEPEPGIDGAPDSVAVVHDPWGRGKSLLAHAMELSAQAASGNDAPPELTFRLTKTGSGNQVAFDGLEPQRAVIEVTGQEKLTLRCYEGDYPAWRGLLSGWKPEPVDTIALSPEIAGRLGRLSKYLPLARLGFSWSGARGAASLEVLDSDPQVDGLVMPCEWDIDADRPWAETEAHAAGQSTVAGTIRDLSGTVTVVRGDG